MTIENVKPPRPVPPPRVVDVSRPGRALTVEIDASEAAELVLGIPTLLVGEERDTYELGADRIDEVRAAAPEDLLRRAAELLPEKSAALLLGLVYTTSKPRTVSAFLEHLAATEPVDLRLHLLGYYMRGHHVAEPETIRRAAEGDDGAIGELLTVAAEYADPEKCASLEHAVRTDPTESKQALLDLLSGWYDHVLPGMAPSDPTLAERDAEAKRELVKSVPPEQVVERLAPGIQWVPGPEIDRVVLFPVYAPRPWVYMSEYKRVKIFCPPIAADRTDTPGGDPTELVRIYKALGDERRLKLLKRLQDGPISLTDAAQEVGLAKSTTHHHLAILRQAGFVLIQEGDDTYTLRPDMRPEPGALLQQYLGT
ncbi:MAG TPA: metalloregulator ArsR/SmtB family transcription factor [Gaiellaceae bacterium]|nr:metalloregulator ArsR/SmtB family transcription factor [Gaiellaceae bacterium]